MNIAFVFAGGKNRGAYEYAVEAETVSGDAWKAYAHLYAGKFHHLMTDHLILVCLES